MFCGGLVHLLRESVRSWSAPRIAAWRPGEPFQGRSKDLQTAEAPSHLRWEVMLGGGGPVSLQSSRGTCGVGEKV